MYQVELPREEYYSALPRRGEGALHPYPLLRPREGEPIMCPVHLVVKLLDGTFVERRLPFLAVSRERVSRAAAQVFVQEHPAWLAQVKAQLRGRGETLPASGLGI